MHIIFTIFIIFCGLLHRSLPIRCYECTSEISYNHYDYDACFYGDERYLPPIVCREPSVCAAYHYQTEIPGALTKWSVSRGCQALRYGSTCEDIFSELRRSGAILPGQHTCTTCSGDLCNATPSFASSPILLIAVFLCIIFIRVFGE